MAPHDTRPMLSPTQMQFFDDNGALCPASYCPQGCPTLLFGPKSRMQREAVPCASGYLVLEDFAAPDEVAKLKQRAEEIIGNYDASNPSIFSTVNQAIGTCDQTHTLHRCRSGCCG
jgi:hypothetical protein